MAWADFPEQQPLVRLLQRSIERDRLGHAYLLTGDDPAVLEPLALAWAKTLNCTHAPARAANGANLDSCGACAACRRMEQGNHPDVMVLRPENKLRQIRIGQIIRRQNSPPRVLNDLVYAKPTEGSWKVGVLVAPDRLTREAANALLKTLEEPPARTLFLLLSTEPDRLLETIRSRCLRLSCGSGGRLQLNAADRAWLAAFAELAIAGHKDLAGRYRLLGKLMEHLAQTKAAVEAEVDAASPAQQYEEVPADLAEQWEAEAKAAAEAEYSLRRSRCLQALQAWLRDVWACNLGLPIAMATLPEFAPAAQAAAARLTEAEASENLTIIERTHRALFGNVNELLTLEVGLLQLKL